MSMKRVKWRRRAVRLGERLEARWLLAGVECGAETGVSEVSEAAVGAISAVDAEPQYTVHQTPRLQPGNAPLVGTPAYTGTDQVDILWQTLTVGTGQSDSFAVSYRPASSSELWQPVPLNEPLVTGNGTRIVHSTTITGLDWDADYEYQVQHLRADEVLGTYRHTFHTRLAPGDAQPFEFVAYGDSMIPPGQLPPAPDEDFLNFKLVQDRISLMNPDFALLLGDNAYDYGQHGEFDARLSPSIYPGAAEWVATHIDYLGIGNHDGGVLSIPRGQPPEVRGKASRDNYSTPISVAGVNAYASPPAIEFAEFNYSFDYGNVHFLTLDMNAVELPDSIGMQRVADLLEYAVADMNASQAQWKIAYFHQPILGTEKPHDDPGDYFFQQTLPSLLAAGVDLVLVGDSHTYAWTHALTGFEDRDQNGVIAANEVDYVEDVDRTYPKGAGLIQVVSGVGGRSSDARDVAFADPFFASGYSVNEFTGPSEYGFAHIEVTQDRLTVSYISAETGQIVGDTNGNGLADEDEPFFGRFQIVDPAVARGDLNGDGGLGTNDIDLLAAALRAGALDPRYDLNADDANDTADYDTMIDSIIGAPRGDANLDGVFNSSDLVSIFQVGKYEAPQAATASWAEGDWNGDGLFTTTDLVLAFQLGTYRV